jgi:hypothetical protein
MPLQIRRGNTAERLSITPLPGEPIFDTTLNQLFVGDGVTAGGRSPTISSLVVEQAIDAVGQALVNGVHKNINFIYGDAQDNLDRIDAEIDLSDYDGEIVASAFRGSIFADDSGIIVDSSNKNITANSLTAISIDVGTITITGSLSVENVESNLKGSVFADNSTLLIDGTDGFINLDGTVKGDIIPDGDELYDIGSPTNKFRDLYLSGTSLNLGSAQITAVGSAIELPAGSTVNGIPIGTGSGTEDGVIEGSTYKINIAADDSTLMVDTDFQTVTAQGGFLGDISSNVVSTQFIDGASSSEVEVRTSLRVKSDLVVENEIYTPTRIITNNIQPFPGSPIFFKGDILPDGDELYDIGSPTNKFRDLYLRGTSLNLGSAQITAVGSSIELPAGSTLAGIPIGTGEGVIEGSNYRINIIATDSSLIIDSDNSLLNVQTITSPGDLFIRPNAQTFIESILNVGSFTNNIDGSLTLIRNQFSDDVNFGLVINNSHDSNFIDPLYFRRTRGSPDSFLPVQNNDQLSRIDSIGWDGTQFITSFSLRNTVVNTSPGIVQSGLFITAQNDIGTYDVPFRFFPNGRLNLGNAAAGDTSHGSVDIVSKIQYNTPNAIGQPIVIRQFFNGANANRLGATRARGTPDSPSSIVENDQIFNIQTMGYDGAGFRNSSAIRFICSGPVSSGIIPGSIEFVTADLTGNMLRRVVIDQNGILNSIFGIAGDVTGDLVGSVFADNSTMIINGTEGGRITSPSVSISEFLQLPAYADDSARSAAISTPVQGMVVFMQTGTSPAVTNKPVFFNGSVWEAF